MQNQIDNMSGNSFIDEDHKYLLEQMDELTLLLRDNWDRDTFNLAVRKFITNVENHLSHEEIILKGVNFDGLDVHTLQHREIAMHIRMESLNVHTKDEAIQFMANTRTQIFTHELLEDQEYWPLFESKNTDTGDLINWSPDLETGDPETDKHHKALVNYINRIHRLLADSSDVKLACSELRTLHDYSKYHFSEEELLLGKNILHRHKANHKEILYDLSTLIEEVEAGKFSLNNIADYLKFWIVNHVQTFDIPAFKNHS